MIKQVTTHNDLVTTIEAGGKVVVVFTAPAWCVPCQRLAPHLAKTAENLQGVVFVEVDIDKADPEIAGIFEIMSVPTVLLYKDGIFQSEVEGRTVNALTLEISGA